MLANCHEYLLFPCSSSPHINHPFQPVAASLIWTARITAVGHTHSECTTLLVLVDHINISYGIMLARRGCAISPFHKPSAWWDRKPVKVRVGVYLQKISQEYKWLYFFVMKFWQ